MGLSHSVCSGEEKYLNTTVKNLTLIIQTTDINFITFVAPIS
jgi:hypothetical protein